MWRQMCGVSKYLFRKHHSQKLRQAIYSKHVFWRASIVSFIYSVCCLSRDSTVVVAYKIISLIKNYPCHFRGQRDALPSFFICTKVIMILHGDLKPTWLYLYIFVLCTFVTLEFFFEILLYFYYKLGLTRIELY